ncbi:MAG TPA: hypothetical protein IGS40_07815 [Trichormus sp. M33_DOE_039]|nr:hypothetical protein [Trichormus sp. M33_DOE_039]
MATVSDGLGNWEQLGTVLVDNQWRIFPVPTISEVFRITTTIANPGDWDKLLRSAAYVRFYYVGGNVTAKTYIRVESEPRIVELPILSDLKDRGLILRDIGCVMSHPKASKVSLASFARWTLKIEGLI